MFNLNLFIAKNLYNQKISWIPCVSSADGTLEIVDGISDARKIVELRSEMDVMVLISNFPQVNNPCNAYNPTPIRLMVWNAV